MLSRRTLVPALAAVTVLVTLALPPSAEAATPPQVIGTHVTTAHPTSAQYTLLEGGATDGTYWYSAVLHNAYNSGKTRFSSSVELLKTRLNGTRPTVTSVYPVRSGNRSNLLGHANAMTYNSDTKQLVIPTWTDDNSVQFGKQADTLRIVSPSTLKITATEVLPHAVTAICYDATDNRYVGRNGSDYYIYNTAFKQTSHFTVPATSMAGTSQSIDCDQSYIYVIRSPGGSLKQNRIYVWSWTGSHIATYEYNSSEEGEEVTHSAGVYYAGFNTEAGYLFRLDDFQYTVQYAAAGGTGSMAPTVVLFGRNTALRTNAFTRPGYTFAGWTAHRAVDGKYLYANPAHTSTIGWYAAGHEPHGWKLARYGNHAVVARTAPRGDVTLTAVWNAA